VTATLPFTHQDQLSRLRAVMVAPSRRVAVVNVPMGNFLMVDGTGSAGGEQFRCAVRALADLSAALRLYLQEGGGALYDPMPLEILWSASEDEAWREAQPRSWTWTAMVAQPTRVSPELVAAVRELQESAHPRETLCRIRLGSMREGLCAQTAHAGGAEHDGRVLARLIEQVRSMGYEPHGPHHEIYLADLRHHAASHLRTIVRQPIHPAA
jgi:hypothetical protein